MMNSATANPLDQLLDPYDRRAGVRAQFHRGGNAALRRIADYGKNLIF
jgi:hypothetical protein